ncbi:WW domain-containing oxidoreductase-like [Tachypleus tridentatus]|uniref:WW domain-containing oxidoreductase-like n=1 Tax=Tachypleus tridentatus TaxID=6853 RepID=UPI003FD0AB8F
MASFYQKLIAKMNFHLAGKNESALDGKVFYVNHETKSTQWMHPSSGKKKKVSGGNVKSFWNNTVS